jgi:hypothetical protein
MRTGLVAVGAAFSLVGAAVIVGILYPGDDPTVERTSSADVDGLAAGSGVPFVLPAPPAEPATLTLTWEATAGPATGGAHVNVSFYSAYACPPATTPCRDTPALASWNLTNTGLWSASGGSATMFMLYVDAPGSGNASINFSATLVEQYHAGPLALPTLAFAFTMVGGGLLTGVGAVALYLGLFLPGGVYGPRGGDRALGDLPGERELGPEGPEPAFTDESEPPG